MKRTTVLVLSIGAVCFIAALCVWFAVHCEGELPIERNMLFNFMVYENEKRMEKDAELIVIGSVKTCFMEDAARYSYEKDGTIPSYHTETTFYIDKVLKGEYDEPTLVMIQSGVIYTNMLGETMKWMVDEYDELKKGNKYILYLEKFPRELTDPYGLTPGCYFPLGVYHGVVNLSEEVRRSEENPLYFDKMTALKTGVIQRFREEIQEVTGRDLAP